MTQDTCPECGEKSHSVDRLTLKALLCPNALARLEADSYRFCPTHTCGVVYFGEEAVSVYHQADLKVRVGCKQTDDFAPMCYCFGHTIGSLREEINKTGASSVVASITAHIQADRCGCDVNNPSGHCCLGEVNKIVRRLLP
jgi:hypothetical protein